MQIIIFFALIAVGAALCFAVRRKSEKTTETERLYRLLEQVENYGRDGNGK